MKNICFFSGDITRPGGTERVSTIIANGLAAVGNYRICFLSIVEGRQEPSFFLSSDIPRYRLKDSGKWISPGPGYLPLLPALRRFIKKHRIDVIIDIDLVLDILSIPAAFGTPTKVLAWEHFHYYYEQESLYRRVIAAFSARFSDYMVVLTPQDLCNYQEKLKRRDRIDYIFNPLESSFDCTSSADGNRTGISDRPHNTDDNCTGISDRTSSADSREKMILTVGRLNSFKGIDLLAQIVPKVLKDHGDWKWYFLGDGEYRGILEDVRSRCRLEDRLVLTGVVNHVEDYLKRASLCVLASRTEPFGMCILEAKACGVPCVSFDVPYGPSIIIEDGQNGFLIPPFDLDQMAEKILLLMEDTALRERFIQNTGLGMEKFRLEPILKKWEELLDGMLS